MLSSNHNNNNSGNNTVTNANISNNTNTANNNKVRVNPSNRKRYRSPSMDLEILDQPQNKRRRVHNNDDRLWLNRYIERQYVEPQPQPQPQYVAPPPPAQQPHPAPARAQTKYSVVLQPTPVIHGKQMKKYAVFIFYAKHQIVVHSAQIWTRHMWRAGIKNPRLALVAAMAEAVHPLKYKYKYYRDETTQQLNLGIKIVRGGVVDVAVMQRMVVILLSIHQTDQR